MNYYKQLENDYIIAIGVGYGNIEITEEEYNNILQCINSAPQSSDSEYIYKLRNNDLTWELCKKDIVSIQSNNCSISIN